MLRFVAAGSVCGACRTLGSFCKLFVLLGVDIGARWGHYGYMNGAHTQPKEGAHTMIEWERAPGGKRYTATVSTRRYRIVKQNVAAGAKRWQATVELSHGRTYLIVKTDYLEDAKQAAENWRLPAPSFADRTRELLS